MPQIDNVYVKNLPHGVSEEVVRQIFSSYGEVKSIKVIVKEGYHTTSTALVKFKEPTAAQMAIDALHGGIPELLQDQMAPTQGLECRLANSPEEKAQQQAAVAGYPGAQQRFSPYGGAPPGGKGGKGGKGGGDDGLPKNYKTMLCRHYSQGACPRGTYCSFAHGQHEIQGKGGKGGKGGGGGYHHQAPAYASQPMYGSGYGVEPTPPADAGFPAAAPYTASTRLGGTEQIEYLKNINHPLLGSLRTAMDQGEEGSMIAISGMPSWMDEAGLYFLFSPYGAVNTCQAEAGGNAKLRYAHARAAQNAVSHLNGMRVDPNCKALTVALA